MPVSTTNATSGPFTANGETTVFPFTFTAPSAAEIEVISRNIATGADTIITGGFTVSLTIGGGGSVAFDTAPATGAEIYLRLKPLFTQDIEFNNGAKIAAPSLNLIADRSAARDQFLKAETERAVKTQVGEVGPQFRPLAELDGKLLVLSEGEVVAGPDGLAFGQTLANAIGDVNAAGATQVAAVNAAGATQIAGVTAAAAAITPEAALLLLEDAIVLDTEYLADKRLVNGNTFTRFFGQVQGGTGSIAVSVLVNGVLVHGPVTVDTDGRTDTVSIDAPIGAEIKFALSAPLVGAPTSLFVKIEGAAA